MIKDNKLQVRIAIGIYSWGDIAVELVTDKKPQPFHESEYAVELKQVTVTADVAELLIDPTKDGAIEQALIPQRIRALERKKTELYKQQKKIDDEIQSLLALPSY